MAEAIKMVEPIIKQHKRTVEITCPLREFYEQFGRKKRVERKR